MRLACIDIGTNTTRLLVAEPAGGGLRPIQVWRAVTRAGEEWAHSEPMPAGAIAHLANEVAHQMSIARAAGAQDVRVVATAVARDAPNAGELVRAIGMVAGAEVDVLSHEREAQLAFLGASRTAGVAIGEPLAVVDIGGGSTELAVGHPPGDAAWWQSLALGSATVTERWLCGDPPEDEEVSAARAALEQAFAPLSPPHCSAALAVGGSAATVGRLLGGALDRAGLERVLDGVLGVSSEVLRARHGLDAMRARVLPGGVLLLEAVVDLLGCPLRVGAGGLREGVILEALAEAT